MELISAPNWVKFDGLEADTVILEKGVFLETFEGKFGPAHKFETEKGLLCIPGKGQLNYTLKENCNYGDTLKIVFKGKEEVEGIIQPVCQFDVYRISKGEKMPEPKPEAPTTPSNDDADLLS